MKVHKHRGIWRFGTHLVLTLGLVFIASPLSAYNYLYIHPATGEPIGWEPGTTIQYYLDPGSLGRLTNEQAHTLLKEAMRVWEEVSPYANPPKFEFAGYLPEDVVGTNYESYVSLFTCYTDDLESCPTEAQKNLQTVIVFDEDGSILENELCRIGGCSASSGARVFSGSSQDPGNIVQGIFVLGGGFAGSESSKIRSVVGLMVHELGHLFGLAHTSVNQEATINDLEGQGPYIPTMYFSPASYSNIGTEKTSSTLTPDDIAGISTLYPSDTFATETATIKGQTLKSDETPMMHVNVIVRNVDDPLCEAYSFLSGRFCQHATVISQYCLADDSEFVISGLPPGTYTLEVEEVADESLAMTLAPGLVNAFIYGDAEFWNEGDVAGDASYLTSSTITLAAGETRENIDIILNRSEVTDDRIKYIPLDTYTPGPGTRCPSEPPVDYAEMIGIDEGGSSTGSTDNTTSESSGGCSLVRGD